MRHLATLSLCILAIATAGCGDDDNSNAPNKDIIGKWVGHYGLDVNNEENDYTFFFRADSSVGVIDGLGDEADIGAEGTWTARGDSVFTEYTYLDGGSS
ncbi:MAG TPA: hypothetical protein VG817_01990 [Gemmatimonadales bacterium]|nr:hypothetical protein [Gemmatimonadales bacterium]